MDIITSDNNNTTTNTHNKKKYNKYYINTAITNNCKCVECTTSHMMDNEYKRDLQSLVLKFCRSIFNSIQEGNTIIIIRSIEQKMFHGDINSKQDLEQIINIFKIINNSSNNSNCSNNNNSSKHLLPCITGNFGWTTSNIVFEWNLNDQAYIIDHILLKISKTWYSPFIDYLCKVDRWQRNSWMIISTTIASASSNYYGGGFGGNGGIFLNVIENCLVGFKYLYDFHWNLMDDDLLGLYNEKGVFLLASECGVFIIILVKPQVGSSNSSRSRKIRKSMMDKNARKRKTMVSEGEDDEAEMKMDEGEDNNEEEEDLTEYYNGLVEDYKAYAIKKHGNKLLTVIGATFDNYNYYDDDEEEEEEEEEEICGEEEEEEDSRQGYNNNTKNNKSRNKKARLMIEDNKYVDNIKFVSETDYLIAKSVKNWYENKISQLSFKDSIKMSSSSSYPYIRKYAPAATTAWTQKQTELQAGY